MQNFNMHFYESVRQNLQFSRSQLCEHAEAWLRHSIHWINIPAKMRHALLLSTENFSQKYYFNNGRAFFFFPYSSFRLFLHIFFIHSFCIGSCLSRCSKFIFPDCVSPVARQFVTYAIVFQCCVLFLSPSTVIFQFKIRFSKALYCS